MSAEPIGRWKRPPCALCGAVIEASSVKPPMFVLEAGVWVHWGCWRRARGKVRPVAHMDKIVMHLDFGNDVNDNGGVEAER